MPATIHAIGYHQYGTADVLQPVEIPLPALPPNGILIRVAAAAVNPADTNLRAGQFKYFIRKPFPLIPGADIAGVVEQVGANVTRFRAGDRVFAMLTFAEGGGYADYAIVAEGQVAHLPATVNRTDAAAAPLTALTALQALRDKAAVKAGMQVLINGASGGVGSYAVQIAREMGATVTAVTSSRNVELARSLGAEVVLDYTQQDVLAAAPTFDVVFDTIGTAIVKWHRVLRKGGIAVSVNPTVSIPVYGWLMQLRGRRLTGLVVQPHGADLEVVARWMAAGKLRSVIDRTYLLSEAVEAQRYSETKRVRGKLVLLVDPRLT